MNDAASRCLAACRVAHRACLARALRVGRTEAELTLLRLTLQCAQLSELTAEFLLGGAPVTDRLALACAEMAEACARGWRLRDRELADTCLATAASCRDLARAAA